MQNSTLTTKSLSLPGLVDRPKRVQTIYNKISNESPFLMKDGTEVILDKSNLPVFKKILESNFSKEAVYSAFQGNQYLKSISGQLVRITKLQKTQELGGGTAENVFAKELAAQNKLKNLIEEAISSSESHSITINIKDHNGIALIIDEATSVTPQPQIDGVHPKADFIITRRNKPPVYISHKDGKSPGRFHQWSGVSARAGKAIENHPEVLKFAEDIKNTKYVIKQIIDDKEEYLYWTRSVVGRTIQSHDLKMMAVFGKECLGAAGKIDQKSDGGPDRVDLVIQGNFFLKQNTEGSFDLTSHHVISRKTFSGNIDKDYEPILICKYGSARASHGIKKARMTIHPMSGKNVTEFI